MLKTRTWVMILLCVFLALAVLSVVLLTAKAPGTVVQVVQDGVVLREIDLSRIAERESFEVLWPDGGRNLVTVEPGRIRVTEADCPDQICVSQGWLSDQAAPIVCMPHRLIIRVKGETAQADAVAQ